MTDSILSIRVPRTPPRQVMPNSRVPRYSRRKEPGKAEATGWLRAAAKLAGFEAMLRPENIWTPPLGGRVRCRATIFWERGRRSCDPDNALAGCKAIFDGLQDAGLFANDRELIHEPVDQQRDPDGLGYVLVELWEAGDP